MVYLSDMMKRIIKENIIKLAVEHKDKCNGHCNISLILIAEFLENAGIKLTKEERLIFI